MKIPSALIIAHVNGDAVYKAKVCLISVTDGLLADFALAKTLFDDPRFAKGKLAHVALEGFAHVDLGDFTSLLDSLTPEQETQFGEEGFAILRDPETIKGMLAAVEANERDSFEPARMDYVELEVYPSRFSFTGLEKHSSDEVHTGSIDFSALTA
jgi:hypothetical protein